MHTSGTGRQAFRGVCFVCFRPFVLSHFSRPVGARGISASLLSPAAPKVCIQTGREGGRARTFFCASALVYVSLHFSWSVWDVGGASASLLSLAALVVCIQAGREGGRTGGGLCTFILIFFHLYVSWCVWAVGVTSASLLLAGALMVCIQARRESGRARSSFDVLPPLYLSMNISPGVCGEQGVQASLYSRWQRL